MANDKKPNRSGLRQAINLNQGMRKLLGFSDDTLISVANIQDKGNKFQQILQQQLDDLNNGFVNDSLLDFAQTVRTQYERNLMSSASSRPTSNPSADLAQQLQSNAGSIFNYFQTVNSNKYLEIADLQFISKFIPALGASVDCLLDSITSTDDLSEDTINQHINFDSSVSKENQKLAMQIIENAEKEYKLKKSLKNTVFYSTLVSGNYYAYCIPYNDLFEQYSKDRHLASQGDPLGGSSSTRAKIPQNQSYYAKPTRESNITYFDHSENVNPAMEYFNGIPLEETTVSVNESYIDSVIQEELKINPDLKAKIPGLTRDASPSKVLANLISERVSTVKILRTPILEEALEDLPAFESLLAAEGKLMTDGAYGKFFGKVNIKQDIDTSYIDTGVSNLGAIQAEKNFNIPGCYIKFIAPRFMVPVKLMGQIVGYYHVSSDTKAQKQATSTPNSRSGVANANGAVGNIFNAIILTDRNRDQIIDSIVDSIVTGVVNNFSKSFVVKNSEFKKVIADCIRYNGYMDNEYHVQFIPAKYVIKFTIDEDDDGEGKSVLANAMFPAKLLLSLQVAKILNYLNNGGDKTLVHVTSGPIDVATGNKVQRVIRNMQDFRINFSDLLSTSTTFNKFGRYQHILIPTAKNGNRLLETEVQQGQEFDTNSEYENMLEKQAIMSIGVPSVIMEYVGQTDFAKGFETANIKYANRVASLQADLEEPASELYDTIIQASTLTDEQKKELKGHVHYRLKRPTVLAVNNSSEQMGTLQNLTQIIASTEYGEDQGNDPMKDKERSIFSRKFMRKYATYIDWAEVDTMKDEAKAENDQLKAQIDQQTAQNLQNGMNDMGGGGYGGSSMDMGGGNAGGIDMGGNEDILGGNAPEAGEGGEMGGEAGGAGGAAGEDNFDILGGEEPEI